MPGDGGPIMPGALGYDLVSPMGNPGLTSGKPTTCTCTSKCKPSAALGLGTRLYSVLVPRLLLSPI